VNWSDFNKPFATRRQNNDGLIILNFGEEKAASIPISFTVHIDGEINRAQTTGYIRNQNTAIFSSISNPGKWILTYRPGSALRWQYILIYIVICGFFLSIVIRRWKRSTKETVEN
jgi:archaellum component FlaG (FlaF/FlaG flagellin family)